MKNVWKVVLAIVAIMLIIGIVAVGVGIITGADLERIHSVLDNRYHVDMYIQYAQQVIQAVQAQV